MSYVQLIITVDADDEDSAPAVLARLLDKLPNDPDFSDVAHTIDGMHVDEEGDPV